MGLFVWGLGSTWIARGGCMRWLHGPIGRMSFNLDRSRHWIDQPPSRMSIESWIGSILRTFNRSTPCFGSSAKHDPVMQTC